MFFFSFHSKKRNVCILLRYNINMQYLFYDYNSSTRFCVCVYVSEYGQTLTFCVIYLVNCKIFGEVKKKDSRLRY